MLPWVYEFHWTVFHITFLLIFFSVFAVVVSTVIMAMRRTQRAEQMQKMESIQWHSDFEDLPHAARICRHELVGDIKHRVCDHEFDCSTCTLHPTFAPLESRGVSPLTLQSDVYGFAMPQDRLYHRGHTWIKKEDDGNVVIGLDDFGSRLIGKPEAVDLPPIGKHITVNGTGWTVKKLGASLRILSPVDGEVIEHGNEENGWSLKVRPSESKTVTAHLLGGAEIRPWIMREMERLQMSCATGGVGATLADGGELVPEFHKHFPKADWDGVLGQMFLEA